jgi:large subunit ribosomal protein L27e
VAGIDRYPRKVVKAMGKALLEKRSKIKPFVKVLNYAHLQPTRYSVDFDLKKSMDDNALAKDKRADTKKMLKKLFEEKYKTQTAKTDKKAAGVQYFYSKLRF